MADVINVKTGPGVNRSVVDQLYDVRQAIKDLKDAEDVLKESIRERSPDLRDVVGDEYVARFSTVTQRRSLGVEDLEKILPPELFKKCVRRVDVEFLRLRKK